MAVVNISKANLKYFKPSISANHFIVYKWLIDSGYTVSYFCSSLNIRVEELSGYFREPFKFKVHHVQVIILLLKDIKEPIEILKALLFNVNIEDSKSNEELKTLYNEIELPAPSRSVPVHRLDYEPKDKKGKP
ncbi:MAG: hypothetical protein ACP5N7_04185 [Candidatus Pacearchaeota archaeon]